MLEDEGYVRTAEQDDRRVYHLSERGEQYVAAERAIIDDAWASAITWARPESGDDLHDLAHRLNDLASLLAGRGHPASVPPEKAARIHATVSNAVREVHAILGE